MKEAFCKYNPPDNPYWCNIIWGYCQFQIPSYVNEHCPIYQGFPNWPIHVDDITDELLQKYSYATVYDDGDHLVSLGDTAFLGYQPAAAWTLQVPYVRFIGRYAFQDCVKLQNLDFSGKTDDFIPILASPTAFMLSDKTTFINDTFRITVPSRLLAKWKESPNWAALKNHIFSA